MTGWERSATDNCARNWNVPVLPNGTCTTQNPPKRERERERERERDRERESERDANRSHSHGK